MSKIPEGLVTALRGIADRLRETPKVADKEAGKYVAERPQHRGSDARSAFVEGYLIAECRRIADELSNTLDVWQKPPPRTRRGRR